MEPLYYTDFKIELHVGSGSISFTYGQMFCFLIVNSYSQISDLSVKCSLTWFNCFSLSKFKIVEAVTLFFGNAIDFFNKINVVKFYENDLYNKYNKMISNKNLNVFLNTLNN